MYKKNHGAAGAIFAVGKSIKFAPCKISKSTTGSDLYNNFLNGLGHVSDNKIVGIFFTHSYPKTYIGKSRMGFYIRFWRRFP